MCYEMCQDSAYVGLKVRANKGYLYCKKNPSMSMGTNCKKKEKTEGKFQHYTDVGSRRPYTAGTEFMSVSVSIDLINLTRGHHM